MLFLYHQSLLYLFVLFELNRLQVDLQVEVFAKLSLTVIAFEFLYSCVGFDVLLKVTHLTESWPTILICTFVWFFTCVDPEMSKELTHALDNLVTDLSILLVMTFEKPILFFKIVFFLYEIENIVRRIRDVVWVTEHSWIKLRALNDSNLIIWQDQILLHESFCQHLRTEGKG